MNAREVSVLLSLSVMAFGMCTVALFVLERLS